MNWKTFTIELVNSTAIKVKFVQGGVTLSVMRCVLLGIEWWLHSVLHTQGETINGNSAVNGINGVSNGSGQDSGEESTEDEIVGLYKVG